MIKEFDFLVIGSGIAGMSFALTFYLPPFQNRFNNNIKIDIGL